ncbi:Tetratricopeptide-like helical domain superfamily [Sesbania bispinosa]|nr:Tetratricopeptide-like helical domain superfamily [Sesbania bispinosa]
MEWKPSPNPFLLGSFDSLNCLEEEIISLDRKLKIQEMLGDDEAFKVLDKIPHAKCSITFGNEASHFPNEFTFSITLSDCAKLENIGFGKLVHRCVIKRGFEFISFCQGLLIHLYSKCNFLSSACTIFNSTSHLDTVSCTVLIFGYVQVGLPEEALHVFDKMCNTCYPDQVAFITVLNAYMASRKLDDACQWLEHMHMHMPTYNIVDRDTNILTRIYQPTEGEDSRVNIVDLEKPVSSEVLLVIIFFHGGSFAHSSANSAIYDTLCYRENYHRHTRCLYWEGKLILSFVDQWWFGFIFDWVVPLYKVGDALE